MRTYQSALSMFSVLALLLGACSLISKTEIDQCSRDQDCNRLGAGLRCSIGVCVRSDGGGEDGATTCTPKEPKTADLEFLNDKCTNATCIPFDNCTRIGLCDGGMLPELVAPPDGGF
jgi:hypothetical protein